MKQIIVLTFVLFLGIFISKAQATFNPGLRGGLSLSTISETHANYRPDFYIGGFGEINISKRYSLQPEINYIRQGSNNVARNFIDPNTQTERVVYQDLQISYLSIDLINKLKFGQGLEVQFGPALDVLLNDNLAFRKTNNDLSFITGLAYKMPSGLGFEIRFKKGLFDVLDSDYYHNNSNDYYFFGDYNTNVNFQIGVTYCFDVK
ncbi:outer membrane beta-barrel protein [Flavobacterium defluvii]|uniref:Outer membrane protein beta-barrel domain-containing protein n=1 Tax=Flavobacterium defluvii TaxID=370979 RepID=A0A1M5KBM2_9FLAO|nr:outer membrane beta-barrel protein [Flavobacterium defluvii]SHG50091.1 Outer membrane protein beta-barrel domain-containing protein [Flavobacterium defluvii]